MDHKHVTPKDFFVWAGAMLTLYVSVVSFIFLLFEYIDRTFPDPLAYYVDPYAGAIRYEIASLIVLVPLFLLLMRIIRMDIIADAFKKDLWIRRWALYLTIFIAGASIVGDLITLINYFLGGDVTMRFVLKIAVVFLIAGGGFLHFFADVRGYWIEYPKRAMYVGFAAAALVVISILAGFFIIGSPTDARLYRFDDQKINDLQNIQSQIINFYQSKNALPTSLIDLNDSVSGNVPPVDPQVGDSYTYQKIGALSFKICATFNKPYRDSNNTMYVRPIPVGAPGTGVDTINQKWQHAVGNACFESTIDPQLYPQFSKQISPVK